MLPNWISIWLLLLLLREDMNRLATKTKVLIRKMKA